MFLSTEEQTFSVEKIKHLFENGIKDLDDCEILGNSLFYYCCGIDPTPIIAFGADYKLYIYCDLHLFGCDGFFDATKKLYNRLSDHNLKLVDKYRLLKSKYLRNVENVELTFWKTKSNNYFFLLFVQSNALKVFWQMFNHGNSSIIPKCFCTLAPEDSIEDRENFQRMQKRTEYYLGNFPPSEKYKKVTDIKYYGDYCPGNVCLWKRMFWYYL